MLHVTACQPWPQLAESAKVSFLVCGHHLELPFLCVPDGRVPPGSAPTTHADRWKVLLLGTGLCWLLSCCCLCFPFGGDWHRDAWSTAPTAAAGNGQFPQTYVGAELTSFVSPHLSFVIWNSTDFFLSFWAGWLHLRPLFSLLYSGTEAILILTENFAVCLLTVLLCQFLGFGYVCFFFPL